MGKCMSKPVGVGGEVDPLVEKEKAAANKDDHAPATAVAATPANAAAPVADEKSSTKASDRSLQQLFAKDEEEDEENGQLKRIPEEDSAEEQEEESQKHPVGAGPLETISEESHEQGSGKAGAITEAKVATVPALIESVEEEKRELSSPIVDKEAVAVEKTPGEVTIGEHAEERPSTPEISESKSSPSEAQAEVLPPAGAAAAAAAAADDEVLPADSGSEQVDEKKVALVTQESDKFELVLKPQASEKFEIEIRGPQADTSPGSDPLVTPGNNENEVAKDGLPDTVGPENSEERGKEDQTPELTSEPLVGSDTFEKLRVDDASNATTNETEGDVERSELRGMADVAGRDNKESEVVVVDSEAPGELSSDQAKEEEGAQSAGYEDASAEVAAATDSAESFQWTGIDTSAADVNAVSPAQGATQEEVKSEEFFEASEQMTDLSDGSKADDENAGPPALDGTVEHVAPEASESQDKKPSEEKVSRNDE